MSYRTIKLINEGSCGKVYLVRHEKPPYKLYAMKSMPKKDIKAIYAIQNEIENLTKVQPHPNIVKLHDVIENHSHVNLIQELCGGPTLHQSLYNQEVESFYQIVTGIIEAIMHCHKNKIVFGDLKPQNIVLSTKDLKYKLTDFGSSAQIDPTTRHATLTTSTPQIAAPEVFELHIPHVTSSYDVWSLGVLIKTMYASLNVKIPSVEDYLSRCLIKDPAQRMRSEDLLKNWQSCNIYF